MTSTTLKKPPGTYGGKSTSQRQAERRDRLIEAGIALIGRQGFDATTLNAICEEAGLTKRYFYESFESREALLKAAFQKISKEMAVAVNDAIAARLGHPAAMLEAGLLAFFTFIARFPDRGRVFLVDCLAGGQEMNEPISDNITGFFEMILGFTEPFLTKDAPPLSELEMTARGAMGAVIAIAQHWLFNGRKQPVEDLVGGALHIYLGIALSLGIDLKRA